MAYRLNPVLISLLIMLPTFPSSALATSDPRFVVIDESSGATTLTIEKANAGTSDNPIAFIHVTGDSSVVQGDNIFIVSSSDHDAFTDNEGEIYLKKGLVLAQEGGKVELENVNITSRQGKNSNWNSVLNTQLGGLIRLKNSLIKLDIGESPSPFYDAIVSALGGAVAGSRIELVGGSSEITASSKRDENSYKSILQLEDMSTTGLIRDYKINVNNSDLLGKYRVILARDASDIELKNVFINAPGKSIGVSLYNKSTASINESNIIAGVKGVELGSTPVFRNDNLPAFKGGFGNHAKISNSSIQATEDDGIGISITNADSRVDIDHVSITALREGGTGVALSAEGTTALKATNFQIHASHAGVENDGGQVTLSDGAITIRDENGLGLYNYTEYGDEARLRATRVSIETMGDESSGISGIGADADVNLDTVTVTSRGAESLGLEVNAGRLAAIDSTVDMRGADSIAAGILQGGTMTLDHTALCVTEGKGIDSVNTRDTSPTSTIIIKNGSKIAVNSGAALNAFGGSHVFQVSDSQISAQTGNIATGILLQTGGIINGYGDTIRAGKVRLDASNALLTGDVRAYDGAVDISIKNGSVLTGSLTQNGRGHINSLTLDDTSAWVVRGNSRLNALDNGGSVAFAAPADATGFKTLTVNDYVGGGALLIHTQLGDDSSPTDRLIINGGATSGSTSLRIVNTGGNGGRTVRGIRVVETANGGTTTPDAFRLDIGSTGYRAGSDTVSINGYDYSLMRGSDDGTAADWYLNSGGPGFSNVSPEGGAYAGNRQAAANLFPHGVHDRVPVYAGGDEQGQVHSRLGRSLWVRVQGRHDEGRRLSEGRVDVDTDSAMLQLGGDLLAMPTSGESAVYVGLMGGYGDARSRSVSTLALSGGKRAYALARGKVSGYAAGLYATWYQNDLTHRGAWADTWMQYGRYTNRLSSDLGTSDYRSNVWAASLEAGYAFQPFADGALFKTLVVEPHAQMIYERYHAADAVVSDLCLRNGAGGNWLSRIGARLYPYAAHAVIRPFLEANWLHTSANPVVQVGDTSPRFLSARNAFELKAGAQARLGAAWRLSAQVFEQTGNGSQRSYGGSVNVSYRW